MGRALHVESIGCRPLSRYEGFETWEKGPDLCCAGDVAQLRQCLDAFECMVSIIIRDGIVDPRTTCCRIREDSPGVSIPRERDEATQIRVLEHHQLGVQAIRPGKH